MDLNSKAEKDKIVPTESSNPKEQEKLWITIDLPDTSIVFYMRRNKSLSVIDVKRKVKYYVNVSKNRQALFGKINSSGNEIRLSNMSNLDRYSELTVQILEEKSWFRKLKKHLVGN